ncbi:MAG: amino acid carrier protein, partial [Bacteroidota bacterium]
MNVKNSLSSRLWLGLFIGIFFPLSLNAQELGLDEKLNEAFIPIALAWEALVFSSISIGPLKVPIVLLILILGACFFTAYFSFINIRLFPLAIQIVRGKFDKVERKEAEQSGISLRMGEVNHFQALTTAISGTVGLGNISMVAVAISIGGPGASFWMIIAGLLGMSSKFVECTLGVKYRDIDEQGKVFGGPMYYLSKGLKGKGYKKLGKVLAALFALLCVGASFGGGNAFQSNQAAAQLIQRFEWQGSASGTILGIIFALLVGIVIIGGIKRIAKVSEKVVPFMAILYVLAASYILLTNFSLIDDAFLLILRGAFSPEATISGGFAGVMIQGFRRAAFSNEAGAGSAAIAHAAVHTHYPASEGLVALLEPFIDTVVVCTMTALVIIIFNLQGIFTYGDVINQEIALLSSGERIGGVNLTSMAFDASLPGFSYVLAFAVVLFAFSSILSWAYYGSQAWAYLFGKSKKVDWAYKFIFLLFTVLGSAISLEAVIKFSEAMIL